MHHLKVVSRNEKTSFKYLSMNDGHDFRIDIKIYSIDTGPTSTFVLHKKRILNICYR